MLIGGRHRLDDVDDGQAFLIDKLRRMCIYSRRFESTIRGTYLTLLIPLRSVGHGIIAEELAEPVRDTSDLVLVQLLILDFFCTRSKRVE